ncbi:MAG TPA: DinB family protein [Flavitalea sp.]|nr:DinB family protein [Flavitalea sp.]
METIITQRALPDTSMFSKTILKAWTLQVARINEFLNTVSDDVLVRETAPGRNSGTYLIGHLIAVNDGLFPLLGFGNKLYPELEKVFISSPDNAGQQFPLIADLRKYWINVNEKLLEHFTALDPEAWVSKHEAVNDEDFAKEPHRNKLNVVISRTTHMSYHLGQLAYLKKREIKE